MPHSGATKHYTRRLNSNGGDVAPAICATICKGVQRQLDNAGSYVLDFYREKNSKGLSPLESLNQSVVQCMTSNQETRTKEQGDSNGSKSRRNS